MKKQPKILKEKEGVSPVIGVILMVAITVIMAAIVAGFVFGVIQTPQATPTASITIDDFTTGNGNDGEITLLHQSGDALVLNDTEIVVYNSTDGDQMLSKNLDTLVNDGETAGDLGGDGSWDTGERLVLENLNITAGKDYEVRIIDTSSGGTISAPTGTA
ncbi:MAG: Pilin/Flagellin PilA family [Candidatus Methanohalarchaeum thermophilum]|uniref:Pilin/Flagellin PilA family n=1 Tax=Methanohalarchaeum thermophilum TaxID=1903181 RepID=A0A1Q6DWH5_METT1|nr:MAG: Pilin/Flagellin PilA family [Candidatus Methanohalarchaeum thermophilum]